MQIKRQQRIDTEYGIPKSTQYYWEKHGLWPKRVKIGARAVGWIGEEIDAVMQARAVGADDETIKALVIELASARHARG
ncbi:helix-turn-helix transcriptional regulator [Pontitalea aquivivens]|uniref:helix-turn-helix transcriptional regulator n=1 Tax=Pontitalea aquivivens TaxID=3388663 RepID=UPI0039708338